ncbi:MAG: hypothetical protein GYA34_11985 [Chloroflexi bacterium]|nr:hypothetical protein [Chloroflexota bacterium]
MPQYTTDLDEPITNPDQINMDILDIVRVGSGRRRGPPLHKSDIIKRAVSLGIGRQKAIKAIKYLENKWCFRFDLLAEDEYELT